MLGLLIVLRVDVRPDDMGGDSIGVVLELSLKIFVCITESFLAGLMLGGPLGIFIVSLLCI